MIPRQAFALKKNRGGTAPVSNISDNEDATAPLWNSSVLSVKNSPRHPVGAIGRSGGNNTGVLPSSFG
jgi:SET domain-containing protein